MQYIFKILCFILSVSCVHSSIAGISYMDPLIQKPLDSYGRGQNPCNPLYWYPRQIPDYCYKTIEEKPVIPKVVPNPPPLPPIPVPMPVPMPIPVPPPMPYPIPVPMPPFLPPAPAMPIFVPQMPMYGLPTNPMPMPAPYPYPYPVARQQAGLVPGIPGIVSKDGGINILPFSDAYSDMLEKHKQKMIRRRLQKVLDDFEDFPRKRKRRTRRY